MWVEVYTGRGGTFKWSPLASSPVDYDPGNGKSAGTSDWLPYPQMEWSTLFYCWSIVGKGSHTQIYDHLPRYTVAVKRARLQRWRRDSYVQRHWDRLPLSMGPPLTSQVWLEARERHLEMRPPESLLEVPLSMLIVSDTQRKLPSPWALHPDQIKDGFTDALGVTWPQELPWKKKEKEKEKVKEKGTGKEKEKTPKGSAKGSAKGIVPALWWPRHLRHKCTSTNTWRDKGFAIREEELHSPQHVWNRTRLYASWQVVALERPPLTEDGSIPINKYGNVDIRVPTDIPLGCIHLNKEEMRTFNLAQRRARKALGVPVVGGFDRRKGHFFPVPNGLCLKEEDYQQLLVQEAEDAKKAAKEGKSTSKSKSKAKAKSKSDSTGKGDSSETVAKEEEKAADNNSQEMADSEGGQKKGKARAKGQGKATGKRDSSEIVIKAEENTQENAQEAKSKRAKTARKTATKPAQPTQPTNLS